MSLGIHITLITLLFTSAGHGLATIPQVPFNAVPSASNPYGFRSPELYRIVNYGYQAAMSINETRMGTAVVSMPIADSDDTQIWLIAALNDAPEYMIFNKATGAVLSADLSLKPARGVQAPPYDKKVRWKMDLDTFAGVDGHPVVLTNVGLKGVLYLAGTRKAAGTPIFVYPKNTPVSRNQGWYLQPQYIEDMQASQAMHGQRQYIDKCMEKPHKGIAS